MLLARLDAFGRWPEHSNSGKASMAVPLRLGQCKKAPGTGIKTEGLRQMYSFHAAKVDRDATAGQQPDLKTVIYFNLSCLFFLRFWLHREWFWRGPIRGGCWEITRNSRCMYPTLLLWCYTRLLRNCPKEENVPFRRRGIFVLPLKR